MKVIRLLPVIFSGLIFAAHVLRFYGAVPALLAVLFIFLLAVPKQWILRLWQVYLFAAALVWIKATVDFIRYRMAMGFPWSRLAMIMGLVIALTVFSIFWLENKNVRQYFNRS